MSEIERLNIIAEWQEQHKQLIEDLDNSKKRIEEFEAENAELKCECRRCVYTDSPCVLSDYGKDKNGMCDHFKDVFEELQDWKKEWQEQVQKATDEGYARTLQTIQLSKAKEIIRDFISVAIDYIDKEDKNYSYIVEAEQFLKGESTTEHSNECHDCAKFDEMPKGPRCKTCDNGSHFQKKEEA